MNQTNSLFFASVRKFSLDFDENSTFVFELLVTFSILFKIPAALFLKILGLVEVGTCGAEFDLRCLLFSFLLRICQCMLVCFDLLYN